MKGPIVVEAAPSCGAAPVLLFALEELGLPYTLIVRPRGHFLAEHGAPGPLLRVGDVAYLGLARSLVSLANDRERVYLEALTKALEPPVRALHADRNDVAARAALERVLDGLAESLADRRFAFEVPTIADCGGLVLRVVPQLGIDLSRWPTLDAYRERLMARPAWARAEESFLADRAEKAAPARMRAG